jgi:hypothetical protein
MVEALGWAAFLAGLVGTLVLISERGYHGGLRAAWFVATLAVPWWLLVKFRSIELDAATGVALGALLATFVRPFVGARTRWVLSDLLLVAVVLAAIASDVWNRTLIPGTVIELVRTWILPYLLGRLCFDAWPELAKSLPLVVTLACLLSLYALFEAVSHVNVLAMISGKKWALLETGEGFRWGLKRAQGVANHPIYFGLLLALTLPWLLQAGRMAQAGQAPRWWLASPVLVAGAAIVTVSRSAHLALVAVFASDTFFRRPAYRFPMFLIAAAAGLGFLAFRQEVLDSLGSYAGEAEVGNDFVKIYGVEYEYSGTRHRDLLDLAYAGPLERAGWLGFGTNPFDNPRFDPDPELDIRFKSIDHHYMVHFLRYGYLGTGAFLAFALAVAWNLARAAWAREGPTSELAAGFFGAFVAVAVMLRGVALSFDFGATWLFVGGFAASLDAYRRIASLAATEPTSNVTTATPGAELRAHLARSGA